MDVNVKCFSSNTGRLTDCPNVLLDPTDLQAILPANLSLSRGSAMLGRDGAETRRSGRLTLRVTLKIYQPGPSNRSLIEEAHAVKVSLWGGLIALRTTVRPGQRLWLLNRATGETVESKVAYLGPMRALTRLVAIEFLKPSPDFWSVAFPSSTVPSPRQGTIQARISEN